MAGFIIINEAFLDYKRINYKAYVSTILHEATHILYFHPRLFDYFSDNSKNQSFYQQINDNRSQIAGDHIVNAVRSHFNCPSIKAGKIQRIIYNL